MSDWTSYSSGDTVEVRIDTRGVLCSEWRRVTVRGIATLGGVIVRDWDDPDDCDHLVSQSRMVRPARRRRG